MKNKGLSLDDVVNMREFAEKLSDIPLYSEDWDNYFQIEMPKKHRETLERLAGEILENDVAELIDWLFKPMNKAAE